MKNSIILIMFLIIYNIVSNGVWAEENPQKVWVDPQRYEIVLLKPVGGEWASGYNEVILLDRETGRTWTLKSKELKNGWVLMPRKDAAE